MCLAANPLPQRIQHYPNPPSLATNNGYKFNLISENTSVYIEVRRVSLTMEFNTNAVSLHGRHTDRWHTYLHKPAQYKKKSRMVSTRTAVTMSQLWVA